MAVAGVSAAAAASPTVALRRDIQGLRGLAVLLVVLGHSFPALVPGGFIGVDVFFVISGFLITRILLREHALGGADLRTFYARRIRRILPPLFVLLTACLVAATLLLDPVSLDHLARSAIWSAVSLSNLHFYQSTDYFVGLRDAKPLLHTWSLAVEAQCYLLYPLVLLPSLRASRRAAFGIVAAGLLASLALSVYWAQHDPSAAYYLTPSRAFGFLVGALIAFAANSARGWMAHIATQAGLVTILACALLFNHQTSYPGLAALGPCLGAALVIWGASEASIGARLLSAPAMVWIGAISYSLYLWHWPVLAIGRTWLGPDDGPGQSLVLLAISVLAAMASRRFVERPFMRAGSLPARNLWWGAATVAGVAVVSIAIDLNQGFPQRFSPAASAALAGATGYNTRRGECHDGVGPPRAYGERCRFGDEAAYPDLAVWGDSTGAELAAAIGESAGKVGRSVMQITTTGCPPAVGYVRRDRPHCAESNAQTLKALIGDRSLTHIVMTSSGDYAPEAEFEAAYARSVRALREAGKQVTLVQPVDMLRFDPAAYVAIALNTGRTSERLGVSLGAATSARISRTRAFIAQLAAETGAGVLDPLDGLCTDGFCRLYDPEQGLVFYDKVHIGLAGARAAARSFVAGVYRP